MKKLFIIPIICLFISACKDDEQFSTTPVVTFDRFVTYADASGKDTAVDFIFSLKDGDGDIGFGDSSEVCNIG